MAQLNPGQYEAVHCTEPKILCLAGAGTGKTFVLLNRIQRLIDEGADPKSFLVLTFTNAAAQNMRDRFEGEGVPEFKTFHAFCYSLLATDSAVRGALGFTEVPRIVSDAEQKLLINRAKLDSGVKLTVKQLSGTNLNTPKDKFEYDLFNKFLMRNMRKENLITFDTLCYEVCKLFVNNNAIISQYKEKYKYVMCDEFQDTDKKQWDFIQSFTNSDLFVVGDALQALYSFRGADSKIIKNLASNPEWKTVHLIENYRSTSQICQFANNMSHYADDVYRLEIQSDRDGAEVVEDNMYGLDSYIVKYLELPGTTAVLCRTNREVDSIRDKYAEYFANYELYLRLCNSVDVYRSIKYPEYTLTFLSKFLNREDYTEFLRQKSLNPNMTIEQFVPLFHNTIVDHYVSEIFNMTLALKDMTSPAMELLAISQFYGLDASAMAKVNEDIETDDDVMHALSILALTYKDSTASLYVGTIHSAKGLEYENVILNGVGGHTFPLDNEDNLNLYYVGVTRAKNNLCILRGDL